jgi:Ca2+/Na+ antiporter
MKGVIFGIHLKKQGFIFLAITIAPFFDWLSNILGIENISMRLLLTIWGCVLIDMVLGLAAARKEKQEITSAKGFKAIWRMVFYTVFLYAVDGLMKEVKDSPFLVSSFKWIMITTYVLAILWEMHSWGENYKRLYGYKPRLFTFMEKLADAFEFLILNKINKTLENKKDE